MQSMVYKYAAFIARKPLNKILILIFILAITVGWTIMNSLKARKEVDPGQSVLDYIAENLKVKVTAGDTMTTARSMKITLSNIGRETISYGQWRLYFYLLSSCTTKKTAGFEVGWINGGLYFFSPIKDQFRGIPAGSSVDLVLREFKSMAKSDHFPNWYVASSAPGSTSPRIIESTKGESLSFVSPFENSFQWKRHEFDNYNPYSPEERFHMNSESTETPSKSGIQVIPTPYSVKTIPGKHITIDKTWVVVKQTSNGLENASVSNILAKTLGLKEITEQTWNTKCIKFQTVKTFGKEQYEIKVVLQAKMIVILSSSEEGAFYGAQTLISMLELSKTIPEVVIKDQPRFAYRGLMIDVSRNFHKKETIKKLIDAMSTYKLNKLHMHLTDDEGWRIEIPTIPELTKYGSRRCNYFENDKCLTPSLGSGPYLDTQGSGFYTVDDFREILRYANERYVQVIPEIDIPGHAYSSIKAMEFREDDLQQYKNSGKRPSYILSDDVSGISSVQGWLRNSVNPCLNATYRFVETILTDLQIIYKGIQKLELVHIGGDEVPNGVWEQSKLCQSLFHGPSLDHHIIKKMFLFTVSDIAHKHGLKVSAWEDGLYYKQESPYDVKEFKQKEVFVNVWNNIWEGKRGGRAIEFADLGYRTILSMATHLYFDHPYEPDPEERGLYWATRYIDTYKVFGLMPLDIYANAEYDSMGNKIDLNDLCQGPCPKTKHPNNIAGMEACVWSETIRNESQLISMTFPRLLAFAERAWHKAEWESLQVSEEREIAKRKDFRRFVNNVGTHELSRLEKAGVSYRIPPPGLSFSEQTRVAKLNTFYPGLKVMMSYGNSRWKSVGRETQIPDVVTDIHVYAVSPVLGRKSRTVSLHISNGAGAIYFNKSTACVFVIMTLHFMLNI